MAKEDETKTEETPAENAETTATTTLAEDEKQGEVAVDKGAEADRLEDDPDAPADADQRLEDARQDALSNHAAEKRAQ
jgi:hypothetical protein